MTTLLSASPLPPHTKKAARLAAMGTLLLKTAFVTIRTTMTDHAGFMSNPLEFPVIITFWHNRILAITLAFCRYYPSCRKGVTVLTSASRDGEVLARVANGFGMNAVRGSSSRRGAAALLELKHLLDENNDIAITPDGPRGPRYQLGPGLIYLAQQTNARIMPVSAKFSHCWKLKSWDGFRIPLPFSRIDMTMCPFETVPQTPTPELFEYERKRIETILPK